MQEANSNWTQQDEVTIRFTSLLDAKAIKRIHQRIQEEAHLQRKLADTLSRASNTESVVVNINLETLEVIDPDKAKRVLLSSGTLIVTAGYPEKVQKLASLLDFQTAHLPRILLVRAYAEHMLGRYPSAATEPSLKVGLLPRLTNGSVTIIAKGQRAKSSWIGNVYLQSKRVGSLFGGFSEKDVDALYSIFSYTVMMRYWGPPPLADRNAARKLLREIHDDFQANALLLRTDFVRSGQ